MTSYTLFLKIWPLTVVKIGYFHLESLLLKSKKYLIFLFGENLAYSIKNIKVEKKVQKKSV
jgi:hypothetical protein